MAPRVGLATSGSSWESSMASRPKTRAKPRWCWRSATTAGSSCSTTLHWPRSPRKLLPLVHRQDNNPRSRRRAETLQQSCEDPDLEDETFESFFEPHPGNHQQKSSGQDTSSHDGARQGVDLRHQLPLLLGHVLFSLIEKDLIVFVAREETPPKQQDQKCGGNDSPADQKVKQWP